MGDVFANSPSRHNIRENFDKKTQERKKNLLYLVRSYLLENALTKTADALTKESNLSADVEVCDNIDLDTILQEYSSFYFAKFNKYPKICRKAETPPVRKLSLPSKKLAHAAPSPPSAPPKPTIDEDFEISIKQIANVKIPETLPENDRSADFEPASEDKDLVQQIRKEIVKKNLGVSWEDCIGMGEVVRLLQEAVIHPLKYPKLFAGMSSWKSILLYGPPGTGKTLVAKALAGESGTTFVNLSSSTFVSKWRGESEKLIGLLFEMGKHCAPTTIFIDELDALASRRDEVQHEASRRFKAELLCRMDGLQQDADDVFVLATSNLPWNIDSAILRRFDKRIFVDLPTEENRTDMFGKYLNCPPNNRAMPAEDLRRLGNESYGLSGSDIKLVCKNARMSALRRSIERTRGDEADGIEVRFADVLDALRKTRPVQIDRDKYLEWDRSFGCT